MCIRDRLSTLKRIRFFWPTLYIYIHNYFVCLFIVYLFIFSWCRLRCRSQRRRPRVPQTSISLRYTREPPVQPQPPPLPQRRPASDERTTQDYLTPDPDGNYLVPDIQAENSEHPYLSIVRDSITEGRTSTVDSEYIHPVTDCDENRPPTYFNDSTDMYLHPSESP